jgi:hypothetical protein
MIRQMVVAAVAAVGVLGTTGSARAADREVFVTDGGATFVNVAGAKWVEKRPHAADSKFAETKRTAAYVELYDRDRDMRVRLYADRGEWHDRDNGRWVRWPGSGGYWK